VAHVAREANLAFDAFLYRIGHLIERDGEPVEVGIVLGFESRIESTPRDVGRGVGDASHGSKEPPRCEPAESDCCRGCDDEAREQGTQNETERALRLTQGKDLVVVGAHRRHRHPESLVQLAVVVEPL
jgi:hypothetical protein